MPDPTFADKGRDPLPNTILTAVKTAILLAFLASTLAFAPGAWEGGRGGPPPPELRWLFPAIWVVVTIGILRFTFPIKRVEMREGRLFVSNYIRE